MERRLVPIAGADWDHTGAVPCIGRDGYTTASVDVANYYSRQ